MLFIVFSILLFLFLLTCLSILWYQAQEVKRRREILEEALWERRHRIPLLLEVFYRAGVSFDKRYEIIDIRSRVSSSAYTFSEAIELEKKLTDLLLDLFQKTGREASLKNDGLYLALQKEFQDLLEELRIALNNYNFALQRWLYYYKFPWFKIFAFPFTLKKEHPLEPM